MSSQSSASTDTSTSEEESVDISLSPLPSELGEPAASQRPTRRKVLPAKLREDCLVTTEELHVDLTSGCYYSV